MTTNVKKLRLRLLALGTCFATSAIAATTKLAPITIAEQGSFAAGGVIIEAKQTYDPMKPVAAGQTLHGDHAYVFYQVPLNAKKHSLVFLHGAGQSKRTWETTPDGREGFQNIFLRKGYSVYLVDQPRRGDAGRSTVSLNIDAAPDEQFWFGQFRMGLGNQFFEGTQFATDPDAIDQFFRQMTPNTGPYDAEVISEAMAAVFKKSGPGVLVTHSQGGGPGWLTAIKSSNVKAIVALEPGSGFVFPENELPKPIANSSFFGDFKANSISAKQFEALTRIPIVIFYGDYIPDHPVSQPHQDYWRATFEMAKLWATTVNNHGGDVTIIHLPKLGIEGNTHFPFSDKNNNQVADLIEKWLYEKSLN